MENSLVIYDEEGFILSQMSGSVREPVGVPFIWVVVPEGKVLTGINVSGEVHVPIFTDIPKSETELLKEQVNNLTLAYAEMMGV